MAYDKYVSIIVIARNEGGFIYNCIVSLLRQTYKKIEIIIIDSCSTDNTGPIINKFMERDSRVSYVYTPNRGFAIARNIGVRLAKGEYIFFTDADCVAVRDWVEVGLGGFQQSNVVGVGGATYYKSREYKPNVRDRVVYNKDGTVYPTCNIAFKKDSVETVNGFQLRFNEGLEDWDIALRLMKIGEIVFIKEMTVFHQKKLKNPVFSVNSFERTKCLVYLIKDHYGDKKLPRSYVLGRVVLPLKFLIIFCPPLLFIYYLYARRFNLFKDIVFIFMDYFNCVVGRIIIWRTAFREKIFLV